MSARVWFSAVVACVAMVAVPSALSTPIDRAEHAARRAKVMAQIGDGAAVFLGATTPASDVAFR